MQILLRVALLAVMLVVIFINPAYIGRSFYNLLLLLLLALGALFWYSSQRISSRLRTHLIDEPILLARSGFLHFFQDGSKRWVTALLGETHLYLLERQGKKVEILVTARRNEVRIGDGKGRKKELLLQIAEEEYAFRAVRPAALLALLESE